MATPKETARSQAQTSLFTLFSEKKTQEAAYVAGNARIPAIGDATVGATWGTTSGEVKEAADILAAPEVTMPIPTITALSPTSLTKNGSGGMDAVTITLTGTSFLPFSKVDVYEDVAGTILVDTKWSVFDAEFSLTSPVATAGVVVDARSSTSINVVLPALTSVELGAITECYVKVTNPTGQASVISATANKITIA